MRGGESEIKILEERLREFKQEMIRAFMEAEKKHPTDSVTNDLTQWADFDWGKIQAHLVEEFSEATLNPNDSKEWADLANMAFLMWWHSFNA